MKKVLILALTIFLFLVLFYPAHLVYAAKLPTVASVTLEDRLKDEIRKMLDAPGHLRPSYTIAIEQYVSESNPSRGQVNEFDDLWANPADTIYTLTRALPYINDPAMKNEIKVYLQEEYNTYKPYQWTHRGAGGARREYNDVPGIYVSSYAVEYDVQQNPGNKSWVGWSFNPFNFYALYKYAEVFNNPSSVLADLNGRTPENFQDAIRTDAWFQTHPHVLNSYIAGYEGYLQLQDLAGLQRSQTIQDWLNAAKTMRVGAGQLPTIGSNNSYAVNLSAFESGGFLWLVPELGDYLYQNAQARTAKQVADHQDIVPYWWVARANEATRIRPDQTNEGSISHYYEYWSLFQAKALALKENREELERYLDAPGVWRGDLFYIQNLVAALDAPSGPQPSPSSTPPVTATPTSSSPTPTRVPGDTNHDGFVNLSDLAAILMNFGTLSGATRVQGDLDGNGSVNLSDLAILLTNFGT